MAAQDRKFELPTAEGEMGIYEVRASEPPRGALIIVHGAFGPNAHVEDLGRRFADYGYRTIVPNFYHRTTATPRARGAAVDPTAVERVCKPHLNALSTKTSTQDLAASIAYLKGAGFEERRVAVIGFCLGGSVAFLAGVQWALGAVISFYGGSANAVANMGFTRSPIDMAADLKTPYLGIFGDHDLTIPVAEIEALRVALRGAHVPHEIVRYADAGHGFHEDDLPELYHHASAEDAERRTFAWLRQYLISV